MSVKLKFLVEGFLKEEGRADETYFLFTAPNNHDKIRVVTPEYLANSLYDVEEVSVYNAYSDDHPQKVYENPSNLNLWSKFFPGLWNFVTLFLIYIISSFTLVRYVTSASFSLGLALLTLVTFGISLFLLSKYEAYRKFAKFILGKSVKSNSNNRYYISSFCKIIISMDCEDIESGIQKIINLNQNEDAFDAIDQIFLQNDIVISIEKVNQKNLVKLYSAKTRSMVILLPLLMLPISLFVLGNSL